MSSVDVAVEGSIPKERAEPAVALEGSRSWHESLQIVIGVRIALLGVALAGLWMLDSYSGGLPDWGFLESWRRWDAHHLLNLAEFGYTAPQSDAHAAAFFPFYPLSVRVFLFFGFPPVVAGLFVSAIASLIAAAYLHRLAEEELGVGSGRRAVIYLTLFPTAVFLIAPYSEALFLAGAIPAFYYARRDRWHLVGLPAAVAMGTRAAGLFLLAGLAVEFLRQRDFSLHRVGNAAAALMIGLLPLLAYGAFLSQAFGDPFQFIVHQREGWGREFVGFAQSLKTTLSFDVDSTTTNWILAWRAEVVAAALGVGATVWAVLKREWGYAVYMGATIGALITSTWYYSIPRMLLGLFPIVLFLAEATRARRWGHEAVVVVFAPLAALGVVVYTQNHWFY